MKHHFTLSAISLALLLAVGLSQAHASDNKPQNSEANATSYSSSGSYANSQQIQGQAQSTTVGGQSVKESNNTTISSNYKEARNPVNQAYAPTILSYQECTHSFSGGLSLMNVGFSGGKTYTDKDCVANNEIITVVKVFGDLETAEAMKCNSSPEYAKARLTAGRPCAVEQQ